MTKITCPQCNGRIQFVGMGGMTKDCMMCNKTGWIDETVVHSTSHGYPPPVPQPETHFTTHIGASVPPSEQFSDLITGLRGIIKAAYQTANPILSVWWDVELDGLMLRNEVTTASTLNNALDVPYLNGITLQAGESLMLLFDEFMFEALRKHKVQTHLIDNIGDTSNVSSLNPEAVGTVKRIEAMKAKKRGRPSMKGIK